MDTIILLYVLALLVEIVAQNSPRADDTHTHQATKGQAVKI